MASFGLIVFFQGKNFRISFWFPLFLFFCIFNPNYRKRSFFHLNVQLKGGPFLFQIGVLFVQIRSNESILCFFMFTFLLLRLCLFNHLTVLVYRELLQKISKAFNLYIVAFCQHWVFFRSIQKASKCFNISVWSQYSCFFAQF